MDGWPHMPGPWREQSNVTRSGERRPVFLLALDWTRDKDPRIPLGHASLLANLKATPGLEPAHRAYNLKFPGFSLEHVMGDVMDWEHTMRGRKRTLGIGVYVWNEQHVQHLLPELRRRGFEGRIVLGGPQTSYAPPGVERFYPDADGFIRGYGETALAAVARADAPVDLPGVAWRGRADTGGRAEADLEQLPSPLLTGVIPVEGQRYLRWETQRGCPFRCTFCQHREPGARLRNARLPLERLREEIALFVRSGTQEIDVLDPIFNSGPMHLEVLEEMVRQQLHARLCLQCRLEMVTPEFLDMCSRLRVQPEFGLQTIHEAEWKPIQRQNNMARVESAMDELAKRRIPYMVTLIYGLPCQTLESFRATVEFCLERRVPIVRAFPLNLLRGTELEQHRARWGLVESNDPIPVVVRSHTFDEADWRQMHRIAQALSDTEGCHPSSLGQLLIGQMTTVDNQPPIRRQ
jgi:radical SAM superfamily enzyme YgiQ (UPF0313 family)